MHCLVHFAFRPVCRGFIQSLFQLLIDLLHFLDPVHGHVGVVDDVIRAERPSFEEVGDEGRGHDLGDELDEEGEPDQGKHDGQSGVEEALAGETHVGVGTEPKTTTVGGVAYKNANQLLCTHQVIQRFIESSVKVQRCVTYVQRKM